MADDLYIWNTAKDWGGTADFCLKYRRVVKTAATPWVTFVSSAAARHCLATAVWVCRHALAKIEVDEAEVEVVDLKEDVREGIPWRLKPASACKRPRC